MNRKLKQFMIRLAVWRTRCSTNPNTWRSCSRLGPPGGTRTRSRRTIPSPSRVTAASSPRTTSSRSKPNSAKVGSSTRNVLMAISVHLPMVNTNFKRKSMYPPGTRQNCASSTTSNSTVPMDTAANLSTLRSSASWWNSSKRLMARAP